MGVRHTRLGEIYVLHPGIISSGTTTNNPQFYMQVPDIGAKVREMIITVEGIGSITGVAGYTFQLVEASGSHNLTELSSVMSADSAQNTVLVVPGPAANPGTTGCIGGTTKGGRIILNVVKTGAGTINSSNSIRLGVFWQL